MIAYVANKRSRILLLVAAGLFVMLPTLIQGIPRGDDIAHHYRVGVSLYESICQGELHPGWNSLSTDGYGDVSFRFYPPLFYYLISLAMLLIGDWGVASFCLLALLSALGGLGVYCWAGRFLDQNLATWAGLFFMISPFYVTQVYQLAMLPQFAACSILPFGFAFLERICQTGKWRYVTGFAITYALLVLTHLPLTVIGSLGLAGYGLLRINKATYLKSLFRLGLAVLLGLAASAFYWMRMLPELSWRRGTKGQPGYWYDYRYNFVLGNTVDSTTVWWATRLALVTLLMALPALLLLRRPSAPANENAGLIKAETKGLAPLKALFILSLGAYFMMLPLSRPLWDRVAFLQEVQLPWRWLTIASMGCAVLGAASLSVLAGLAKTRLRSLALLAVGCLLITFSATIFQVIRGANFFSRASFSAMIETIAASESLPDWLPVWATAQPELMRDQVEAADRQLQIVKWQGEHRVFQVAEGTALEVRVKTYYYPHWEARAGGQRLATRPAADGALLISVPAEAVTVELDFCEPPRVAVANILSLVTWLGFAASSLLLLWKKRAQGVSSKISEPEFVVNHLS